ncbi:hypothetical protein [Nodularia sp. UHCC 0506]|nr:hypothetical protein [Nodularia sp. UHCC 0506]MEA5512934.1 hypothetical protein [Nodularia sp. UHCC 0506]
MATPRQLQKPNRIPLAMMKSEEKQRNLKLIFDKINNGDDSYRN